MIKRKVLRKGLEHIPDSLRLWEAVVEFANEEDAKLQRAMECCPLQVEVWLSLSRLGKYDDAKHISLCILTQLIKFLASDHLISWSKAEGFATELFEEWVTSILHAWEGLQLLHFIH